jgi:TonB family protein
MSHRHAWALAASAAVHAGLCAVIVALCARSPARAELLAELEELARVPVVELGGPIDVEVVAAAPAEPSPAARDRDGDGTRAPRDVAPSAYPGRERARPAPAAGQGPGVPAVDEWTGHRDAQTVHTLLQNATAGYRALRSRTADRSVTGSPAATRPEPGTSASESATRGVGVARTAGRSGGLGPGAQVPLGPGDDSTGDGTRLPKDGDERPGQARPLVAAGPGGVFTEDRDEPHTLDDADARQRSADPHPHARAGIELTRAASPGPGSSSGGPAQEPGFAAAASRGEAALPLGDPLAPRGEEFWLRSGDRRYLGYFQRVYERVRRNWVFPRRLARDLLGGEVVVSFTIRRDGRIDDIAVRKSSGFREFDENVVRAVELAAPLPPVPPALGAHDLRVQAPFEYLNPLVR